VKALLVTCFVASCLFLGGISTRDAEAEDSALKKINLFGKRQESSRASAANKSQRAPAVTPSQVLRPFTPAGVKHNIQRLGNSTRTAWGKTRRALAPQNALPRLQVPRLQARDAATDNAAVTKNQKSRKDEKKSPFSLTSWLFSADN
jgi:hypothetical protein